MIHETLFCLWNSPESVSGQLEWTNLFELQEFLHPGEKKLLQWILDIAMDYHKIIAFTNEILNNTTFGSSSATITSHVGNQTTLAITKPVGLYTKAFCCGVHKVLEGYRKEIINLENMFLQNPKLSLTFILSSIEKYRTMFNVLKSVIQIIQSNKLHGCHLMGTLHKYLYRGMDSITLAAEQIICSINTIFYRHLCNWIIYGNLDDIYGEFFIRDGNCLDEDFLYPDQMTDSVLSTGSAAAVLYKKTRIKRPPAVRKFYIDFEMVPTFISINTAESILFMGRIVWIVRNDPKRSSDDDYQLKYKRDIWEGRDIEYYKKIEALESQPFNMVQFQATIEECRIKLTKYLWSIMLEEGNLMEHLHLIRDYYALGRGELFQQFIVVAEKHFKDSGTDHNIQNMNFIFLETARKIYGENDKTYMRFEFTAKKSELSGANPWSKLQINFEINWPLHIVFHPKAMELYNKLFCYLLQLKKTQINLNKLWQLNIDRRVWTLRQHLMFLVNNLQYYLQVDVIEAHFSVLLKAIQNASEFEDIIKVHHEFISNLLSKTFLLTAESDKDNSNEKKHKLYHIPALRFDAPSKVYNVIMRLLDLCDEFCLVASTWESTLTEPAMNELEDFQKRTHTIVESLLFILYNLHERAKGQHLLQLLYQLDFNGYFSKNKPNFSLAVS